MQMSLRSVWRCTWMAIAAPLATCGGYGRMAGGGHGVGGMRKACCLCQVEVMFQQRMCRLFCMALDVRLKALSLRGASCCVSNLCVCVPCVRAAMPTTWVSFVLQFSLRPWCCLFCSCLCFVVLFVAQLSLRSWRLFVRAVVSALRQARCVFRSCEQERVVAVRSLNSCAWASVALSWPFVAAGAASVSRSVYRKRAMAEAMVDHSHFRSLWFRLPQRAQLLPAIAGFIARRAHLSNCPH